MHSTSTGIMLWVHGTYDGDEHKAAVYIRDGESLEDTIARGCTYILESIDDASFLTNVYTETMDEFDYDQHMPLMDGQIPGGILQQRGMR